MKAIIPVAGVGSRLRPHTHTQPKALIPVAGKAILAHIIDGITSAGVTDFVLVVGYLADKIEAFIARTYPELNVEFVTQEPRRGIAHSIWVAREHVRGAEEVLIVLGDTIVDVNLRRMIDAPCSTVAVKKVETPSRFGVAEVDAERRIRRLIEKPRIPKSNLALVGVYKIRQPDRLLSAIEHIMQHDLRSHGEYHLTDALMHLVTQGEEIATERVRNWFDCGQKNTLLEANAILLNGKNHAQQAYDFPNTIIIPPVSIGENCVIEHSIVGPNVAVGEESVIRHSIVRDTIVGSYSELTNAVLEASIIGNDTAMKGLSQSLNIGDDTEINFNSS